MTLVIGLVANVFTAVFVSRTIFDWELGDAETGGNAQYLKGLNSGWRFCDTLENLAS